MSENVSFERDRMILEGRIYPAIQSCVNNRYKIILGIFVYYGFIVNARIVFDKILKHNVNLWVSIFFSLLVIHNLVNYWWNNMEETKYEHRNDSSTPHMEIGFAAVTLVLIWLAFLLCKYL